MTIQTPPPPFGRRLQADGELTDSRNPSPARFSRWTHRESNPDQPVCRTGVLPLDDEPSVILFKVKSLTIAHFPLILGLESALRIAHPPKCSAHGATHTAAAFASGLSSSSHSGPDGSRTHRTDLARVSRLQRHAGPQLERSVRESNPVLLLTTEVCFRSTYRPSSDPGWNRTIVFLAVDQASLPLDHGIASDRGRSRTCNITRLSTWSLCQFAYSAAKLQAPVSSRAHRPHEGRLGACQACNRVRVALHCSVPDAVFLRFRKRKQHYTGVRRALVTKGRVELPRPNGHDILSVACLPIPPLRLSAFQDVHYFRLPVVSAPGRSRTCTARRRVGYGHGGSPMPSRRMLQVAQVGVEPTDTKV